MDLDGGWTEIQPSDRRSVHGNGGDTIQPCVLQKRKGAFEYAL
jgi:hypothetical protein